MNYVLIRRSFILTCLFVVSMSVATVAAGAVPADTARADTPAGGGHAQAGSREKAESVAPLAAPPGYPVTGIDVSGYQPGINWGAVAGAGARFAYAKATEGTGYLNPEFGRQYNGAKGVGLYAGAYDFGRPDQRSGTSEADFFLAHAAYADDGRTLPPMLDIEWPWNGSGVTDTCYHLSPSQMVSWIRDFVTEVRVRTGQPAMIYTATSWWNQCTGANGSFGANPLFIANYNGSPGTLPPGWSTWTMWQYAASGSLPGDQDVFNGDASDLAALVGNVSGVSSVTYGGALRVFARGEDGALWQDIWANGAWTWQRIGGRISGRPSALVDGGVLRVFARGVDGALWQARWAGGGWTWQSIGGKTSSEPSAVLDGGLLRVFARGADGALWQAMGLNDEWTWQSVGGRVISGPSAVLAGGLIRVFARGLDNALWQATLANGAWSWRPIGGVITGGPSVLLDGGLLRVFARGADGALWQAMGLNDEWTWQTTGGRVIGGPSAVLDGDLVRVFARGVDNALWQAIKGNAGWTWQWIGGLIG
jgi:GH25 family lysozyme M1 (1,4-beta-N-acetylmuramidase)